MRKIDKKFSQNCLPSPREPLGGAYLIKHRLQNRNWSCREKDKISITDSTEGSRGFLNFRIPGVTKREKKHVFRKKSRFFDKLIINFFIKISHMLNFRKFSAASHSSRSDTHSGGLKTNYIRFPYERKYFH